MKIAKIQSSGKKGTQNAALFIAQMRGIPVTGYHPYGAECQYKDIQEAPSSKEEQSVIWNVRDAHATLFIGDLTLSPMASLAYEVAESYGRPNLISNNSKEIIRWLDRLGEEITLNITGPDATEDALSERKTKLILEKVLSHYDAIFIV